jgi:hypothetical protein
MNSQTQREVRLGLIALALSGLLFALGIALRGPIEFGDPESFIRPPVSPNYVPAWTIILVGGVLQLYGFFGLYRYLTFQASSLIAFLALVLSIAGIALFLPLATFFAVNGPVIADLYQEGNQQVIAVVEANFTSALGLALLGVSSVAGIIGVILFAIAIWRHGRLPKWTGVLFALSLPLLVVPVTFTTELLGAVILLISAGVMAWKGWQDSVAGARQ